MFLTYGSYEPQWWDKDTGDECSPEDIAEVLQFSLAVSHFQVSSRRSLFYHLCYDAVWALAYALHQVVEDIYIDDISVWDVDGHTGSECGLLTDCLCQNTRNMSLLMNKYLKTTNFTGISVKIHRVVYIL